MFYEFRIYQSRNEKKNVFQKMCSIMSFLSFRFSTPKIPFAYVTTISETPKTVKDNFEECRGAGRNCLINMV